MRKKRYGPPETPAFLRRQLERRIAPFIGKDVIVMPRKRWRRRIRFELDTAQ